MFSRLPNAPRSPVLCCAVLLYKFTSEAQSIVIFLFKFIFHNTLPISYDQNFVLSFHKNKIKFPSVHKKMFSAYTQKQAVPLTASSKSSCFIINITFIFTPFLSYVSLSFNFLFLLISLFHPCKLGRRFSIFQFTVTKLHRLCYFGKKGLNFNLYSIYIVNKFLWHVPFIYNLILYVSVCTDSSITCQKIMLNVVDSLLDHSGTCFRYFLSK